MTIHVRYIQFQVAILLSGLENIREAHGSFVSKLALFKNQMDLEAVKEDVRGKNDPISEASLE